MTRRRLLVPVGALMIVLGGSALHAQNAPVYRVDPFWPRPLPNKWLMQQVPTLTVDKDDHIWVLNRPRDINPDESGASTNPPRTDCCIAAPAVLAALESTSGYVAGHARAYCAVRLTDCGHWQLG